MDNKYVKIRETIGRELKDARRNAGLSLLAVQEKTQGEFHASAVGSYERGDRDIPAYKYFVLLGFYETGSLDYD